MIDDGELPPPFSLPVFCSLLSIGQLPRKQKTEYCVVRQGFQVRVTDSNPSDRINTQCQQQCLSATGSTSASVWSVTTVCV